MNKKINRRTTLSFWLLLILVCYTPIVGRYLPVTHFGAGIPDLDALRIVAYLLVFIFTAEKMAKPQLQLNSWIVYTVLFGLIVTISPLLSPHYSYTTTVMQELFNTVLLPPMIAFIAFQLLSTPRNYRLFSQHVIVGVLILCVICIVQFLVGSSVINDQQRSMGTFDNPNALAVYLVLCLPFLLTGYEQKVLPRWILMAAHFLLVVAIVTTVSRKGILTLGLSYVVFFWLTRRKKMLAPALAGAVILAVIAAGYSQVSSRFTGDAIDNQVAGKVAMVKAGLNMFIEDPLVGKGYKGYYHNYTRFFPTTNKEGYDAHNEYITALVNFGIIGFIVFMAIFIAPLRSCWQQRSIIKRYPRSPAAGLLIGVLIAVVSFMLNQIYAGTIFYQNSVVFMLYINIAAAYAGLPVLLRNAAATTQSPGAKQGLLYKYNFRGGSK